MNVFTWIPNPLHLYHNHFHYQAALPLAFARPHSVACEVSSFPQKVIHSLCWWAVIQLSLSRRCSDDCRTGVWHPTSALSTSQFKKTLSKGILSNFFSFSFSSYFGLEIVSTFHFVSQVEWQYGAKWQVYFCILLARVLVCRPITAQPHRMKVS